IKNSPGPPYGDVLQTGVDHSQPTPVTKPGMKISISSQFRGDPARFHFSLEAREPGRREIIREQTLENRFGSKHATLDRRMNSFQASRIQKTCAVADNQNAVCVEFGHGVQTAGGNCLRAVTDHLATIKQLGQKWMSLEALELCVGID